MDTSSELLTRARVQGPAKSPHVNVPYFRPSIGIDEIKAVTDAMSSGWLTTGPKCSEFEQAFSCAIGSGVESVALNSATAGLHLVAEACNIGPDDEVLVPTLTFTATAEAFHYSGAKIVLVDIDPETLTIDLEHAASLVNARTKAIVAVHFGGYPCDMPGLLEFSAKHRLRLIEDAAHAFPAHRDGRSIGSWPSDACVFSFYANKTITTGEGGMLVTRDRRIAQRARLMRAHGMNRDAFDRFQRIGASWRYDVVAPGFKYNLTDMAAAIGLVQLRRAEQLRAFREAIAERYFGLLNDLPLDLPSPAPAGSQHAWHLFPIRLHPNARMNRDDLFDALAQEGIGCSVHYRPLHEMTYWRDHGGAPSDGFPAADRYFAGALSLPIFPGMTGNEVDLVASSLRRLIG